MKGFPKIINNRNDLDNVAEVFPNETREYLDNILANRKIWAYVSELENEENGIVDDTNKVVVNEDTISGIPTYTQYKLVDNLDLIKPFGFSSFEGVMEYTDEIQ